MLETLYTFSKWVHIVAGIVALVIAPLAMMTRKGGDAHRRWGWIYYWSMAIIFVTTLLMLLYRPNIFLLAVAVLSFYSAFAAQRVVRMKRPVTQPAQALDYVAAGSAVVMGIAVTIWGVSLLLNPANPYGTFAILGLVFGFFTTKSGIDDLRRFRNPPTDKHFWWFYHMNSMLGSYIGAITAFMVQTVSRWMYSVDMLAPFAWLVWLLPLVIGFPLIGLWERKYKQQFALKSVK
jgi:uncharacterized membrane protein